MATPKLLTCVALLALALQGCSSTPRADKHFGEAVRTNLAAQTLNPNASSNTDPAVGIDGTAARGAQERYAKSFEKPEQQPPQALVITR
jgi:type IV pilus biogenesis protein CpaD/CtpE